MSELTSGVIMIRALEEAGRIEHIDVDAGQLEEIATEFITIDAGNLPKAGDILREAKVRMRHSGGVKNYRIYYAPEPTRDPLIIHTLNEVNTGTLASAKSFATLQNTLEGLWSKTSPNETEVFMLMRAIERKEKFFRENTCLSPEQLAVALDITDKNIARGAKKLVDANEIIGIKRNERYVYPAFQFNREGLTYPALKATITVVKEHEINNLDFCIWLSEYCSEVLHVTQSNDTYEGISFEDMMDKASKANANNKVYQGKPIDAVVSGDTETFNQLFNLWLSPETYDVHHAAGAMHG